MKTNVWEIAECGCGITWDNDPETPEIVYCSKHGASDQMYTALKNVEWAGRAKEDFGHGDFSSVPCCPTCGNLNFYEPYKHLNRGHAPECSIGIALALAEGGGDD